MFQKLSVVLFFYFLVTISALAQKANNDIKIGSIITIHSQILNEDRPIWIHLPPNHDPKKPYPVFYVLDGDFSFPYASGTVSQLSRFGKIPEMIMVAIPNTDRTRDLTPTHMENDLDGKPQNYLKTSGGGDNFLKFIKTELSPYIEKNYTSSKFRILAGHSLGGLLATHAFLEEPLFINAFIAIDPSLWWDDKIMIDRIKMKLSDPRNSKNIYYMSSANNFPDPKGIMHPNQIEFMKHLSSWKTDSLIVKNEYFENDDHGSVDLISFYNGLQFIFDGYKLNYTEAVTDPDYINNHYEKFAKKLGHKFSPTESVINRLGYTYLFEKNDAEQALKMFKSNIENYPNSSNAYDSIADAYKELGNREMTIKSYEKAIELDPAYDPPRRKLEEYLKSTQIK